MVALQSVEPEPKSGLKADFLIAHGRPDADAPALLAHEQQLLHFLFHTVADDKEPLRLSAIQAFAAKRPKQTGKFLTKWHQAAIDASIAQGLLAKQPFNLPWRWILGSAAAALVAVTYGMIFTTGALVIAIVALIFGVMVEYRFTEQGAEDLARWKAFRQFLKHFSLLKEAQVP